MRPVFGDGNVDGEDLERRGASAREASDIAMQRKRKMKGREGNYFKNKAGEKKIPVSVSVRFGSMTRVYRFIC